MPGSNIVGKPWRGNLRTAINEATNSADWIKRLFVLCKSGGAMPVQNHRRHRHPAGLLR